MPLLSKNTPRPIREVAHDLGIADEHLVFYGTDKAKVRLEARAASPRPPGKLILVSAVTPTDAGEGKTTTSIGLAQGLAKIGENACLALREPSLGPTFGLKGGATGGGLSTLTPSADINLHFTGDFHAITSAHNLLAALLDNHIHHIRAPEINPRRILWSRVMDMNDRSLRHVVLGLGGATEGIPRESGFDITPASEVMATLCLAEDAEDLRARLSRMIVGLGFQKQPITAADLEAVGSMMLLLKDAIMPNLVQSVEGVPAFVHGGPFANIAHGCNSVIATKMAMAHSDWTVTEAGFGFSLGAEKFLDIKAASAGLDPAAIVIVATVRALKRHGGVKKKELGVPNPEAVAAGLGNLKKHIENARAFNVAPVVALNRFENDSDEEIAIIRQACAEMEVSFALSEHFAKGGDGAVELAKAVVAQAEKKTEPYRPLYNWTDPVRSKIDKVATTMYGADEVVYGYQAEVDIRRVERLGYADLPVCIAKTAMSLSEDKKVFGRPEGFKIHVRSVVLSAGAGLIVPLVGDIIRMPGLPKTPQASEIDFVDGEAKGLLG